MKALEVIGIIAVSVILSLVLNLSVANFTGMAVKDTATYMSATWTCADGTIKTEAIQVNANCKTRSEWSARSVSFCSSHCKSLSKNVKQCAPSKFVLGTKCEAATASVSSSALSSASGGSSGSSSSSSSSSGGSGTSTNLYSEAEASSIPISSSWSGTHDINVNTFNILAELDSCPKLTTNPGQACKTVCEASHLKCVLAISKFRTPIYDTGEYTPENEKRREFITDVAFGECNFPASLGNHFNYASQIDEVLKVYTDTCICC